MGELAFLYFQRPALDVALRTHFIFYIRLALILRVAQCVERIESIKKLKAKKLAGGGHTYLPRI